MTVDDESLYIMPRIVLLFAILVVLFCGMAGVCSFSSVIGGKCGSSRGYTECVALNNCDGDISSHLANHHLTREKTCERDLILARAGLLELTEEQIKNMMICPAHRFTLGKYWQAPKTCQYPRHHGKKTAVTGTHVINFKLAREIKNLFGDATPVGSRKCYNLRLYFLLHFHCLNCRLLKTDIKCLVTRQPAQMKDKI